MRSDEMTILLINSETKIEGSMSVSMGLKNNSLVIDGALKTDMYIEEIDCIESERYFIDGVTVISESFGTDNDDIIYNFTAKSMKVKRF